MKEIVILSGKGGTGKTSLVGAFAALARGAVLADCDVDAADLHLLLQPTIRQTHLFRGGKQAAVRAPACTGCGTCLEVCRFGAVRRVAPEREGVRFVAAVDPVACEGCGVCAWFCPAEAIRFDEVVNGEWYESDTRFGTLVHARLGVAEENSGKLVSAVRNRARAIAEATGAELVLVDGSPGIGCPVIASIAGADLVLVVTDPTLSGEHDLERVLALTRHFGIRTMVCVNKADLHPEMAARIEARADRDGYAFAGTLPYDAVVTGAQKEGLTLPEYSDGAFVEGVRTLWARVLEYAHKDGTGGMGGARVASSSAS